MIDEILVTTTTQATFDYVRSIDLATGDALEEDFNVLLIDVTVWNKEHHAIYPHAHRNLNYYECLVMSQRGEVYAVSISEAMRNGLLTHTG